MADTGEGRAGDVTILAVLAIAVVVSVSNTSASSVAQPAIAAAFDAGAADVGWVVFGFSITFAVGTGLYGGLGARFGPGRMLAAGMLVLALGSLAAAVAPSLAAVIGARLVQGVGTGAIPTLSAAIIARRFAGRRRALGFGVVTGAVGVGQAIGPMLGGLLVQGLGWRAAVAVGVAVAPLAPAVLRDQPQGGDRSVRLDPIGIAWVVVAVGGLVTLVNRLPVVGATWLTAAAAVAMTVGLGGAAWWSRRAKQPFLPPAVLGDRRFLLLAAVGALGSAAYLGTVVGLPPAVAPVHGLGPVALGLLLLPMAVCVLIASLVNGPVQERLGGRGATSVSLALLLGGALLVAAVGIDVPLPALAAATLPMGLGFGLLSPPLLGEVSARHTGPAQASAVALFYLVFFVGVSLGGALSTAFVQEGTRFVGPIDAGLPTAEVVLAALPFVGLGLLAASRARDAAPRRGLAGGR